MSLFDAGPRLRPLGLGEVLDRAVNLSVKHFVPFTLILLVYMVPFAVINFLATKDSARLIQAFIDSIQAQTAGGKVDPTALQRAIRQSPPFNAWLGVELLAAFFVSPLAYGALTAAVAEFYLGRVATFGQAYRVGLERWPQLVGLYVMYAFLGGIAYFVLAFAAVIVTIGVVAIWQVSHPAAIAAGIILGLVATLTAAGLLMLGTLAAEVSVFTAVVEKSNFVTAFAMGLQRIFGAGGFRRSLLFGFAYVAVTIGVALVAGVGDVALIGLVHSHVVAVTYATVVALASRAFTTAFVGIFYFDLRVREEGLDLQLAAQAAGTPSSLPA